MFTKDHYGLACAFHLPAQQNRHARQTEGVLSLTLEQESTRTGTTESVARETLLELLRNKDSTFWEALRKYSESANTFDALLKCSTLQRRAETAGLNYPVKNTVRLALIGGANLYPLHVLIEHLLALSGYKVSLFLGKYDNYVSEIMDESSELYAFGPEVVFIVPSQSRCRYDSRLTDSRSSQQAQVSEVASQLLTMCERVHNLTKAEVLLCNFLLPTGFHPGPYRTKTLGSDWNFRKAVNLELGLNSPASVHICDLEFLAYRRGGLAITDARRWFESKQPCAPDFLVDIAQEAVLAIIRLKRGPKKVLVLDLDNTLWGGVVADDSLEGIEIGDTSPRGEAFKAFQKYVLSLTEMGVLLAVCSKNDHAKAMEPFEKHPEMVLKPEHFVSFKANWGPKSENIRQMAAELNLGLDSFVFADDNPAEIDIVRQFAPEVSTVLLGADPSQFVALLEDSRFFEPRIVTTEDAQRTNQYRQEAERQALVASATDMPAYLESLDMKAVIREFDRVDAPRISQLINKSNQFNLTTRRRTEAEVAALIENHDYVSFTVRLSDRFGDHGLIAVVIGQIGRDAATLEVDTWLMSCRVLNRQVEEETINEIVRLAARSGCTRIRGVYLPTPKNDMVRGLYPRMGFQTACEDDQRSEHLLDVAAFTPFATKIAIAQRAYDTNRSN